MAIEIITGFDLFKDEPVDRRKKVADSTARLAISYVHNGLESRQQDTGQVYLYIGTPPSNLAADWILKPTWVTGSGVPDNADNVDGDMYFDEATNYIYQKVTSAWILRANLTGAQIFAGSPAPTTEGVDGDMYFRYNGDVYQKAAGSWGSVLYNISGVDGLNGDVWSTTSTTSVNIPTSHPTDVALTVDTGLAYTIGQTVISAEDSTNFFIGIVKTYVTGTGVLTITSSSNTGTGSAPTTAWEVNLNGAVGARGTFGKPGVADKTYTGAVSFIFNEAEITSVEGDSTWTTDNPYIAYILKDDRSNTNAPAAIAGDQTGDIVTWDGSVWYDVGRVRGLDGSAGNAGWSPALGAVTRVQGAITDTVLQLNAWIGGTGGIPASLTALVGRYVAGSGLVTDIALATNIKGDKGDTGNVPTIENLVLTTATKNMNRGNTRVPNPPTSYNINFHQYIGAGKTQTWEISNMYTALGYEQMYIKVRVSAYQKKVGGVDTPNSLILRLWASLGGGFGSGTGVYDNVLIETINIPIFNASASLYEIRAAYGIPSPGDWYWRVTGQTFVDNVRFSRNYAVIYEIFKMNSDNQPAV